MGQTLENGVYLPSEGERNCYAGLKTNWEILDQKVADVTALQQAVAGALHREIVESLPTTDIDPNTIYMILSGTSATENVYNEYMYVNNAWELIGTSATDLTNYYTKAEVDGKLLLKANASDLTSHTSDATIHVTASDKAKWTNSANTVVLRLAKTALTPSSSTNAFSNLDDSTALKVGDKVMDTAGVLFEVTAIDTQNSTFTIGTALIDLAQDSDVVHKTGDETIAGVKTFSDNPVIGSNNANITVSNRQITANGSYSTPTGNSYSYIQLKAMVNYTDSSPSIDATVGLSAQENAYSDGKNRAFNPTSNNIIDLGLPGKRWANVYATNYYYGSSETEFSSKFVTTDTNQTISGQKVFTDINAISSLSEIGVSGDNNSFKVLDKNKKTISRLEGGTYSSGMAYTHWLVNNGSNVFNGVSLYQPSANLTQLRPCDSTLSVQLGASNRSFSDCYTSKINGVEPSSLSLPVFPSSSSSIDISSYITDMTGSVANSYTPPANGYITFVATGSQVQIFSDYGLQSKFSIQSGSTIRGYHPVLKNEPIKIYMLGTSIESFRFIPCQGNV